MTWITKYKPSRKFGPKFKTMVIIYKVFFFQGAVKKEKKNYCNKILMFHLPVAQVFVVVEEI